MKRYLKKLLVSDYDIVLAFAGAVILGFLAVFVWLREFSILYSIACLMAMIGCLSYKFVRDRKDVEGSYPAWKADLLFWACIIGSVITYLTRVDMYVRPLTFFVLLSLSVGALVVKIVLHKERANNMYTLAEIGVVGLLATLSISFLYPSLIGMDPWWHMRQTLRMVNEGIIDTHSLPVMYILVAGVIKITGWSYRVATIVAVAIPVTLANIYLIYYLGKLLINRKIGLLAGLFVSFAGWNVFFIVWTIPNALAMPFVLGIIISTLKWLKEELNPWKYGLSLIFLIVLLVYTHPIATIWACIFLGLTICVTIARQLLKRKVKRMWGGISVAVAAIIIVVILWTNLGYIKQLVNLAVYDFNPETLKLTAPSIMASEPEIISAVSFGSIKNVAISTPSTEMLSSAPVWESLWNVSGMFIYLSVALCGVWHFISKRSSDEKILIILFGIVVLGAGFLPMLMGMSLLEHRWWLLAEIIMAIPLAWTILKWASWKKWFVPVAGLAVAFLCFTNLMGLPANMDNRDISKNQLARYSFTAGELEALRYISGEYAGTIGVDEFYTLASNTEGLIQNKGERIINISPELLSGSQINTDVVIIRNEVRYGLMAAGGGTVYRLNYDPVEALEDQGYRIIYEKNDVIALSK